MSFDNIFEEVCMAKKNKKEVAGLNAQIEKELDRAIKDAFGKLAHDFSCKNADDIYYEPLAEGVRHFKETEKGRDTMCESFERLADKVGDLRVEQTKIDIIKLMMKNMKCTLEEALNALEIKGKERAVIAKQLQKQ